ncbi:MAG: putative transcriptional regulator [Chthonomonadaceae bacterium]|nr:putative transcriptional regulator [Chthonomonadaceae bacterium]
MNVADIDRLLLADENERCEFKEAKTTFRQDRLMEYCTALANELGGILVLGITDAKPRSVVGTSTFQNLEDTKHNLLNTLRLRVEAEEIAHPDGRVIVFSVPSRPVGMPLHIDGRYLMRSGESLVPMSADHLQRIFAESGPDFSAEVCKAASVTDLDTGAIEVFRGRWLGKSGNAAVAEMSTSQLLEDSELSIDGDITYAALILLGKRSALGRYLPNAEVILEYRAEEGQIPFSRRFEYRQGFLSFHDDLWKHIDARNDIESIRDGLFRREIPAFNEDAVREAILNAVCHRDYRLGGSVFIRQYPTRLEVISPGGFPPGITPENILKRQSPRNRRLAEACGRCSLVERSGQGMDRIYASALREGKARPQFTGTDDFQVALTLRGEVIDPRFLRLLDMAQQHGARLDVDHLIVLDHIRQELSPTVEMEEYVRHLIQLGLLERIGKGRASKVILSRGMYTALGEPGAYTRYAGLDRETKKQLILQHIKTSGKQGAALKEFRQVLPQLTQMQVRHLVYELRLERKIELEGRTKNARWFLSNEKE